MLSTRQINNKLGKIESLCKFIKTGVKLGFDVTESVSKAQKIALDIENAGLSELAQVQMTKILKCTKLG